ncbi:hypothetical protein SDC9_122832 [bioreactor metagenome]|uniref:Uncharacterized protein n=1 Tax=bioreactor metagenome TaxID=1076179 RepID=A0A645CG20_9ZZZZ
MNGGFHFRVNNFHGCDNSYFRFSYPEFVTRLYGIVENVYFGVEIGSDVHGCIRYT